MPEYDIGTQDWLHSLYSEFWDTDSGLYAADGPDYQDVNFGQGYGYSPGNAPSVGDWEAGFQDLGYYTAGITGSVGGFDYYEDVGFSRPLIGYGGSEGAYNQRTGMILNLDDWKTEYGNYMPVFNPENMADARMVGKLDRDKSIDEILGGLSEAEFAGSDLSGGQGVYDAIYQRALTTGRLKDFETEANIYDLESSYEYDVYNQIAQMQSVGAFSTGGINQGVWQTTYEGGWDGSDPTATGENSGFCMDYCSGAMGEHGAYMGDSNSGNYTWEEIYGDQGVMECNATCMHQGPSRVPGGGA